MKKIASNIRWITMIALGCAVFALGFDLFLEPNGLSAGGISGIALIFIHLAPITTVGVATALMNLPLFFFGGTHRLHQQRLHRRLGHRHPSAEDEVPQSAHRHHLPGL